MNVQEIITKSFSKIGFRSDAVDADLMTLGHTDLNLLMGMWSLDDDLFVDNITPMVQYPNLDDEVDLSDGYITAIILNLAVMLADDLALPTSKVLVELAIGSKNELVKFNVLNVEGSIATTAGLPW